MTTTVIGKTIADQLLIDLGAPTSPGNERAVSIWLAFENSTIVGNNPWNITGVGTCGSRQYNNRTFAVYCTLDDGIAATARLLKSASYYAPMVSALRNGDPIGFLHALVASPWDGGHYGNGVSLYPAWSGAYNYANKVFTVLPAGSSGGGTTPPASGGPVLDAFLASIGRKITDPIRQQDIAPFIQFLQHTPKSDGTGNLLPGGDTNNPIIAAMYTTLQGEVGKPWSTVGSDILASPGVAQTDPLQAIAGFIGKLFDPQTWIALIAFGAGGIMIVWGVNRVIGATGGPSLPNVRALVK